MTNEIQDPETLAEDRINELYGKVQALLKGQDQQAVAEIAGRILDDASCRHVIWTRENYIRAARTRFTDERNVEDAADYISTWTKHGLTDATAGFDLIDSVLWGFEPSHEE